MFCQCVCVLQQTMWLTACGCNECQRSAGHCPTKQAGRQAGRQAGILTDNKEGKKAGGQAGRQTDRQTGRQAGRQTNTQKGREAGRQAGKQADRPTAQKEGKKAGRQANDRPTDRQAGRQAGRQSNRKAGREKTGSQKVHTDASAGPNHSNQKLPTSSAFSGNTPGCAWGFLHLPHFTSLLWAAHQEPKSTRA